jgi:pimeloyl-ACP methyl ester carboxylesterase
LSLGGRILIDFALEHPDMVESLAAIGPGLSGFPWAHDDDKRYDAIWRAAQEGQIEKVADLWLASGYMAPAMEQPALAKRLRQLDLRQLPQLAGQSAAGPAHRAPSDQAPQAD